MKEGKEYGNEVEIIYDEQSEAVFDDSTTTIASTTTPVTKKAKAKTNLERVGIVNNDKKSLSVSRHRLQPIQEANLERSNVRLLRSSKNAVNNARMDQENQSNKYHPNSTGGGAKSGIKKDKINEVPPNHENDTDDDNMDNDKDTDKDDESIELLVEEDEDFYSPKPTQIAAELTVRENC